jgi:hypothetical protein
LVSSVELDVPSPYEVKSEEDLDLASAMAIAGMDWDLDFPAAGRHDQKSSKGASNAITIAYHEQPLTL